MNRERLIDGFLSSAFTVASLVAFGLAKVEILGVGFSSVWFATMTFEVKVHTAVSVTSLVAAWAYNKPTLANFSSARKTFLYATLLLILGNIVVPEAVSGLTESTVIAGSLLAITIGGFFAIAHRNA